MIAKLNGSLLHICIAEMIERIFFVLSMIQSSGRILANYTNNKKPFDHTYTERSNALDDCIFGSSH